MKVEGSHTMSALRERVYETLSDPAALRCCLPGCDKFEETAPARFETTLKAGIAGIKGTFTGTVVLSEQVPPASYTLAVEGSFSGGFVKGTANITLDADGDKTVVKYLGEGQISGPLASVGQRLLQPASKMVVGQFFRCMEGQVPK